MITLGSAWYVPCSRELIGSSRFCSVTVRMIAAASWTKETLPSTSSKPKSAKDRTRPGVSRIFESNCLTSSLTESRASEKLRDVRNAILEAFEELTESLIDQCLHPHQTRFEDIHSDRYRLGQQLVLLRLYRLLYVLLSAESRQSYH